jgi:hypothetical protein
LSTSFIPKTVLKFIVTSGVYVLALILDVAEPVAGQTGGEGGAPVSAEKGRR